jgi:hypothetical protein
LYAQSGFLKIYQEPFFYIQVMKLLTAFSIFVILILSAPVSKAQEVFLPGSRSLALAGASVSLADCWSVFGNQAGLAKIDCPTIGGTFQNRFLVKELSTSSGLFILPIHSSVLAFSFYQFGKTTFRHEKIGIAFARSLNPRLHFGLQFNYYRFFLAEENRNIGSSGVELGFQYQLTNRLLLGIHSLNPYKISIKTFSGEYSYTSRFNIGAHYQLSESFGLVTELEKDLLYPLNIKTGLEYAILNKLFIRTGISGKPYQLTAGMGFAVKKLKMDLAVAYNQYLGNSPSVSFQYQF